MIRTMFLGIFLLSSYANEAQNLKYEAIYQEGSSRTELPEIYKSMEGLSGKALLKSLHDFTGKNYKTHEYGTAKEHLYDVAYNFNGKTFTVYSDLPFGKQGGKYMESGDQDGDGFAGDFVNCEHVWPQSKFNKITPMVSDLHHLYPSLSIPNGRRSSWPFGIVAGKGEYGTRSGSKLGGQLFEPSDPSKGNVARAMMYFYTRYYDRNIWEQTSKSSFWDSSVDLFLKWNQADPVDSMEKTRNEKIEAFQGNRNPFIDFPDFANRIGKEAFISK